MNLTMTFVSSHFESSGKYYQAPSMPLDTEWVIMNKTVTAQSLQSGQGSGPQLELNVDGRWQVAVGV